MTEPFFFPRRAELTLGEIAALTGARPGTHCEPARRVSGIAPVDQAAPGDLCFLDSAKFTAQASICEAGACLTRERLEDLLPERVSVLIARDPYRAFVEAAHRLFPDALRPSSLFEASREAVGATVHPRARLERGVIIDPGAVIGPDAEIGAATLIGPGAVIGPNVRVGRECAIGAHCSITHALIGDRVVIHPGCRIGQDGFGYLMSASGHIKVPQIGRVIIQDRVEIGANTAIDRGAMLDTVIGEGTKIDNLVQIGHNVIIGRDCILTSQTGISGSAIIEDGVMMGGQTGIADHLTIGEGSALGAKSGVMHDVPRGARWVGIPAKPIKQFFREVAAIERLAGQGRSNKRPSGGEEG
jgi:UDP-3-O-[3-hydroxymyristoyl] glucosamine N-acyltransferase